MNGKAAEAAGSRFGAQARALAIGADDRSFVWWLGSMLGRATRAVAAGGSLSLDPSHPIGRDNAQTVACWACTIRAVEAECAWLDFANARTAIGARVARV